MSKLEELRNLVSKMFEGATDEKLIRQAGAISSKLEEVENEQNSQRDGYNKLLNDYKDVVLHSSFKPQSSSDLGAERTSQHRSVEEALSEYLKNKKSK